MQIIQKLNSKIQTFMVPSVSDKGYLTYNYEILHETNGTSNYPQNFREALIFILDFLH